METSLPNKRGPYGGSLVSDAAIRRFAKEVDLVALETFLIEDGELDSLARAMKDPAFSKQSLVTLLHQFGVSLSRIQEVYTKGMRHIGLIRMSTALPEIMAHVAEDAKSKDVLCPRCDGKLVLKTADGEDRACPVCKEKGTVRVPGDKHARDLVFESMKLTNQNGPMVAIQQNFRNGDDESMASMFKMTQQIAVGPKEPEEVQE